jgi:dTDP-4-dehydrorhamnose 3,5-epimerase-like enzyme
MLIKPYIIIGASHSDIRGNLLYNNDFFANQVKRIYVIENNNMDFVRGWQGHNIEQRWFTSIYGSFKIWVQAISNFETNNVLSEIYEFELNSNNLNVLHIPPGYVTAIQSIKENSRLLVMADYFLGEIQDEFRFPYQ